jgi:hypothetical protein
MELLNLCVNCRFYIAGSTRDLDKCGHIDAAVTDWVRGAHLLGYCYITRGYGGKCGHEAKLFIQKDTPSILEENHV